MTVSAGAAGAERILRVDMTRGTLRFQPFPATWRLLGGRGLSARILATECDPRCDPLGAENVLVLAPGVLSGSSAPTSGRISIGAKSPLTGGSKEANAGGEPGQHLMKLGIRAVVVTGAPADAGARFGLEIDGGGARLIAAQAYRHAGNYELCASLRERYGEAASFIVIGPAGERRLKAASVACSDKGERYPTRHAARGGLGAVMGAKGLKYIAIDPGRAAARKSADGATFTRLCREYTARYRGGNQNFKLGTSVYVETANMLNSLPAYNRRDVRFAGASTLDGTNIVATFPTRGGGMHNCMTGCIVRCSNRVHDASGGYLTSALEFETLAMLGSNCGVASWESVAELDRACDDAGLDTIEVGAAIGVYMDAGRMAYGDVDGMRRLLAGVSSGTGDGPLVGDGAAAVARCTGHDRVPVVKGQSLAAWEPRTLKATGVTYLTSPQGADHTAALIFDPALEGVALARASQELQLIIAVNDSSGCCHFLQPTLDDLRAFYGAFHGIEVSRREIADLGWAVLQDEWDFNRRAGFGPADDRFPDWFATEAVGGGAVFDVPAETVARVYERFPDREELYRTPTTA
jgi:aldehyde:ferredoxin oxidoreductase